MADRRLVIVRDHPALLGRAEADDRLAGYLSAVPSSVVLLFYCTRKPDARKKLYLSVKKQNGIVTFSPLKDRELTTFVTSAFRDLGKECDERTADLLIFTCGSDTGQRSTEIAKIASHAGEAPSVHPDDVRTLATPSAEGTVFQMVDAVVSGQQDRAFRLMRNQLLAGSDRLFMLSMLLRQFRLLQHIRIMQYEKCSRDAIRSALGVPPFAVDQYVRQASMYTNAQIKKAVSYCFDAEYAVKSGRMNQEGSLETVMLKLLNLRSGS
jgi:DNA polymerase-3 subunit delta